MAGRDRSKEPLFRPEAVTEQQESWLGAVLLTPRLSYTLLTAVVALLVAGVIGLVAFGEYTRKARLAGWLAPERGLIQIVAPQSGVLTQVSAQEGLEVAAGAPLAVLSAERRSELGATQGEVLRALHARRNSLIAGREHQRALFARQAEAQTVRLAVMAEELAQMEREFELQRARVELADTTVIRQRELRDRNIVVEQALREAEEEVLDQRLELQALQRLRTTLERGRLELQQEHDEAPLRRELEFAEIDRSIAQIEQELAEAEAQREVVISAPQAGTLTAVRVAAGGGVSASEPLMTLVPQGARLEARTYGPSRSIGFVRPGQRVLLRYDAYPHQKFGRYSGTVTSVSRATVSTEELAGAATGRADAPGTALRSGEPVYRVTVALDAQSATAYGEPAPLQPGMTVEADVQIETRRVYQWVLDPLRALTGRTGA